MSGGSQHNPNGRQSQIGAGWSPLQLQVASLLARAPQAHMAMDRGHTWHTPTPQPHLYHPTSADPLQAMKGANVFRHMLDANLAAPPDKHLMRHTPSPGDPKSAPMPPVDLFPHLGSGRDKHPLPHPNELLARGVDLSVGSRGAPDLTGRGPDVPRGPPDLTGRGICERGSDLSTRSPDVVRRSGRSPDVRVPEPGRAPDAARASDAGRPPPAHAAAGPALSVRDAPTINSLIARAQPRGGASRVDSLLERLGAPVSPHSVIVHARPEPLSPHSSNEDSTDSCGAPSGSKRKRKPERTIRVPLPPTITRNLTPPAPLENGDSRHNGPDHPTLETHTNDTERTQTHTENSHAPSHPHTTHTQPEMVHTRRKSSSETIDDIAAMIKNPIDLHNDKPAEHVEETPVTIDKLKSVLASEESERSREGDKQSPRAEDKVESVVAAAAPKRRRTRTSNTESTNVPVESPSEAKPAETSEEPLSEARTAEPTAVQTAESTKTTEPATQAVENTVQSVESSDKTDGNDGKSDENTVKPVETTAETEEKPAAFVEVENQLEKMFAGLEEEPKDSSPEKPCRGRKRRKSAPSKGESTARRRAARATTVTSDERRKRARNKPARGTAAAPPPRQGECDSASNASSGRSRGPYVQIRGPRESPVSVCVINAPTAGEDEDTSAGGGGTRRRRRDDYRNGMRVRGLHQSTLGLRYDAVTPDATWLCAFCQRGPHANQLGDLFGPYSIDNDCEEYRTLDEPTRRRYESIASPGEVWMHESCAVWAPGLLGTGARLWGLSAAVWGARGSRCDHCGRYGAAVACTHRGCAGRTHVPCAAPAHWLLNEDDFHAKCYRHLPV